MTHGDAVEVSMADAMRQMHLRVRLRGLRRARLRLWLAGLLFRLAARVAGTGIEIEDAP